MSVNQQGSVVLFSIVVIMLVLALGGGYLVARNNGLFSPPKAIENKAVVQPSASPRIVESKDVPFENEYYQEFTSGHTFSFKYPVEKDMSLGVINGRDSGWPISPLEQTFIIGVNVNNSPYSNEQRNIQIGYTDIDPTKCLNSVCPEGGLESILKIESATVSGILSKKVEGTAHGGGGVLPLNGYVPLITLYVVPYKEHFFIISASPQDLLERVKNSFTVSGN
jgi:hypothetical protein